MRRQRRRMRLIGLAGPTTRVSPAPAPPPSLNVLVVAHVFYPTLWPELAERISLIRAPRNLAVTLVQGHADHLRTEILDRYPGATVQTVPNLGRDQLPMMNLLRDGRLLEGIDVVLKLHSKASEHRLDGRRWRRRMLDSLCGSTPGVDQILALFGSDPTIGIVTPSDGLLGREFWGQNSEAVDELAARLGVPVDLDRTLFPGGSMYWARTEVLARLRDLDLGEGDFAPEPLPSDGTLAHALERLVGVVAAAEGLDVVSADSVPTRLARIRPTPTSEDIIDAD